MRDRAKYAHMLDFAKCLPAFAQAPVADMMMGSRETACRELHDADRGWIVIVAGTAIA